MLVPTITRAVGAGCLIVTCIVATPMSAQAAIEPDSEIVLPPTTAATDADAPPNVISGGITNDIWDLLNSVSDRVNTAITRAQEARDRATEARNRANEMVDNMDDGLQNLTGEMRVRIEEAVATLQQALLEELAGAADFINGPNSCSPECEGFRADLITLLTGIQDISNALLATSAINGQVDFSAEIDFVESLSGKALYPLYRVLHTLPVFDEEFLATMSGIAANLAEVAPFISDTVTARGGLPDVCQVLADNDELASNIITAAQNIDKVGKVTILVGSLLNSIGKTKITARVGIWGWAGVSYTGGLLERMGGHLESLGNRLSPIADKLEKKLQYCVLKVNQQNIIGAVGTNHQEVVVSQQAILDALKAIPHGNGADLNGDGMVNLADFSLFQNRFGTTDH